MCRRLAFAFLRAGSLALTAAVLCAVLMRAAPGYFADEREMDAQTSQLGLRTAEARKAEESSFSSVAQQTIKRWAHGDLGQSREYDVPVRPLLRARAWVTFRLVTEGLFCGFGCALAAALALSGRRSGGWSGSRDLAIALPPALLLALPVGAMATVCLVVDRGGPVLVLAGVIAARDFKLLDRLLRQARQAGHFLYARAAGLGTWRAVRVHLLPALSRELLAVFATSVVLALSLAVPVEVVFDVPGLGQMAWAAALNRDLPVLLAVTLIVAFCVGLAGALAGLLAGDSDADSVSSMEAA